MNIQTKKFLCITTICPTFNNSIPWIARWILAQQQKIKLPIEHDKYKKIESEKSMKSKAKIILVTNLIQKRTTREKKLITVERTLKWD